MKLVSITFDRTPRLPGLRAGDLITLDCDNPPESLKDWRLMLRGQSVYFVSPPGWTTKRPRGQWDKNGPTVMHEVPRATMFIRWALEGAELPDDVMKLTKYESQPFGWKPVVVAADKPILGQIPNGQMGDA